MRPNDRPRVQATLPHILDGTYRIKSKTADVYLTCPQDVAITVIAQQSDAYSDSQMVRLRSGWMIRRRLNYGFVQWSIFHVEDGAYSVVGHRDNSEAPLSTGGGSQLICVPDNNYTTWTFEPRGSAYVSVFIHCRPCYFLITYLFVQDWKCCKRCSYPSHTEPSTRESLYVQVVCIHD